MLYSIGQTNLSFNRVKVAEAAGVVEVALNQTMAGATTLRFPKSTRLSRTFTIL
jgi:hypothetical protein